jgi:hypothetical protein
MDKWHRLRHKETGDEQTVGNLEGYTLEEFDVVELDRRPDEDDEFDWGSKKLKKNAVAEARLKKQRRAASIKYDDLVDMILDLRARIEQLEKAK